VSTVSQAIKDADARAKAKIAAADLPSIVELSGGDDLTAEQQALVEAAKTAASTLALNPPEE
jgi:hypothetical protein